jgi:hypothetical protein
MIRGQHEKVWNDLDQNAGAEYLADAGLIAESVDYNQTAE